MRFERLQEDRSKRLIPRKWQLRLAILPDHLNCVARYPFGAIWRDCFANYKGPYLFGGISMADAMYAPVCSRFLTYDVALDTQCAAYCRRMMELPQMREWIEAAKAEPDELEELDAEF